MDSACDTPLLEWVSPFGDPRIKACSRLPGACRSVPRPSSPLGAKASTRCPCFPRPTPATTAPLHQPRPTTPPDASLRSTPGWTNSSNNSLYKRLSRPQGGRQSQHTHAILTRRPTDGRRGADASLASARHAHDCTRGLERNLVCPRTGFTSPPYDVQRTRSLQHGLRAAS